MLTFQISKQNSSYLINTQSEIQISHDIFGPGTVAFIAMEMSCGLWHSPKIFILTVSCPASDTPCCLVVFGEAGLHRAVYWGPPDGLWSPRFLLWTPELKAQPDLLSCSDAAPAVSNWESECSSVTPVGPSNSPKLLGGLTAFFSDICCPQVKKPMTSPP